MDTLGINLIRLALALACSTPLLAGCATAPVEVETVATQRLVTKPPDSTATEEVFGDPFEGADLAITGLDGNIMLANTKADRVVPLTGDALPDPLPDETFVAYSEPTWSPTDERLAFIRTVGSRGEGVNVDIVISGRDFEPVEIAADGERPFYLYWSPRGDQLSFLASSPGETMSLWVKDLQGEGDRLDQGQPYYWDWAPDGSRLISHVGGSIAFNPDGAYLSFFNPDRTELDLGPLSFQAPAYSPDGDRILVASRVMLGSDSLLLLGPDGKILQEVAPLEGRTSFAWAQDGVHFAVASGPDLGSVHIGVLSLFRLNDEGVAELKQNIGEDVISFWWTPDGRKLAYFVPVLSPTELTQPVSMNTQADSELFLELYVYDLEKDISRRLTTFRPTQEFIRIMPYFDQYQRSSTLWSADSETIAYASLGENGLGQIFIVHTDGDGVPRRVAPGQIAYWAQHAR